MARSFRMTVWKSIDSVACLTARVLFGLIQFFNKYRPAPAFKPKWSDVPLLKSWEKSQISLGWPRQTTSLCPKCTLEAREKILNGEADPSLFSKQRAGEIPATIVERDGQIWMVKECPKHGKVEDILSIDAKFTSWIESNFPGCDLRAHNDSDLHWHGTAAITHGRGGVLTVDLTNRCNMMCDPCFTDANQVGFVHEPCWEDIKQILENAMRIKPRRQMSVQFSGGEPTLSPHFLRAIKYARKLGFNSVQCATNGIRFAQDMDFARKAAEAGLRYAYLQFDGIGNDANSHRHIQNLFDVKLHSIENMHEAGIEIVLVITLVNGVNNDQIGPIVRFALDNPKKIAFLSFQPVSFTGRDEAVTPERRFRQRYTLSHLANDVKNQVGLTEPGRDWFPLSLFSTFSDFADLAHGPDADWGQVTCSCHPNCGVGTALMVDKETGEARPVPQFLDIPGLIRDLQGVTDAGRGKWFSNFMMGLALMKNYRPFQSPSRLTLIDILKKFDKSFGLTGKFYGVGKVRRADPWNFLFIAGMWFQDLFNYDFSRTQLCAIPYGTQEGEISFCAYNTGQGWRNIVEHRHRNATVSEWYQQHGRHEIHAGEKNLVLNSYGHSLQIRAEDANRVRAKTALPQTARDEKMLRKRAAQESAQVREQYDGIVNQKQKLVQLDVNQG
jgi:7,8-dihydro-6-hydroxymethylpterin dimethyltransferase